LPSQQQRGSWRMSSCAGDLNITHGSIWPDPRSADVVQGSLVSTSPPPCFTFASCWRPPHLLSITPLNSVGLACWVCAHCTG
jgi:hypothetical protein